MATVARSAAAAASTASTASSSSHVNSAIMFPVDTNPGWSLHLQKDRIFYSLSNQNNLLAPAFIFPHESLLIFNIK